MDETRRILVVEDDPVQLALLSAALGHAGYDTVTARSPGEALEKVKARPADAVVADVRLQDGDAFEVLGDLRRAGYAAPLLMVSGQADAQTRGRAIEVGASGLIEKPVNLRALVRVVRSMVTRPAALLTAALKVLVVESEEPLRRRMAAIVEGAGLRVEMASGIDAALELVKKARIPYDFAVVDLNSGGPKGVEALLGADSGLYVVTSNAGGREAARAAYRAGADAVLQETEHLGRLLLGCAASASRKRAAAERQKRRESEPKTTRLLRRFRDWVRPGGGFRLRMALVGALAVAGALLAGVLHWGIRESERAERDFERAVRRLEQQQRMPMHLPAPGAAPAPAGAWTPGESRRERPLAD
jgi:DNA-binding response OmpR family regulator